MTDRLTKIFEKIPECQVFADIGCDHGYIAKAMIKSGKANKVIISDISAKCLLKAEELLAQEISDGSAISVVSNGFEKVGFCDVALIAGMGGEEICSIIESAITLPKTLVLQPMKNCDKVRLCAVKAGYKIIYDQIFYSASKFYDLMVLTVGKDSLTQEEIEFGRTNVKEMPKDFREMISKNLKKLQGYLDNPNLDQSAKQNLSKKVEKLKKYVEI